MSGTIGLVVVSYQRPRMLGECLASINGAAQVVIADDGSTFDVQALASGFNLPNLSFVFGQQLEPWQRMRRPTCGKLINAALRQIETDHVSVICDDDLMAPGWLQAAGAWLDKDPGSHMVMGDWLRFNDGEPLSSAEPCVFDIDPPLTTGNFAVRTECAGGCGCWWSEDTVSCHDYAYLDAYLRKHGSRDIAHVGTLAGYRREHPYNMLRWMGQHNDYKPEALALFESGMLEPVG
jgi:glycosyltransferase involved in cell wall biosynthesis